MGGEGNTRKIIIKTKAGLILENQLNPLISELGTAADLLQEVWNEYLCQTLWTDRINDNSCTCSKFSYACKCHDDSFLNIHFKEKSEWLHVLVCILKQEMLNIQIHHTSIFLKGSWLWKEMQTVVVKSATPPHPHPPPTPRHKHTDTQLWDRIHTSLGYWHPAESPSQMLTQDPPPWFPFLAWSTG